MIPTGWRDAGVKITGVVTLKIPGQGFILEDSSGGIRALTRQTNDVQVGDAVAVLGFPVIGDFSPYLEEASFRRLGNGSMPSPKQTSAEKILLQGTTDNLVVEIKARLLQSVPQSPNPQLVLQDGPIIFLAHLETQSPHVEVRSPGIRQPVAVDRRLFHSRRRKA